MPFRQGENPAENIQNADWKGGKKPIRPETSTLERRIMTVGGFLICGVIAGTVILFFGL